MPKKENIEIIFKKPSFFFGLKFLNEISLSDFVNKVLSYFYIMLIRICQINLKNTT